MSSSPTPAKRNANGGDTGDQKASDRTKVDDDDVYAYLAGTDDESEDTDTVAPADEEVVETAETNLQDLEQTPKRLAREKKKASDSVDNEIEGPEQTSDLDAKLLKVTKELCRLQSEVNLLRKEAENKHGQMEVIETPTETPIKTNPQGTTPQGHLNANDNDDENEDAWENPFVDEAGAYSRDGSLYIAGVYFEHARIYAKFSKQLESLDSLVRDTIQPPCAMVVDTIQHFATKEGHSITDLEVLEKAFNPGDGWKELAKSIGPWTDYGDAEAKFEEIVEAFLLEVARLAKDMKKPLEMTLFHLRRDLRQCTEPFYTRNELARYLESALHNIEAEPGTLEDDYDAIIQDLVRMKETYRIIRKGFTKYKCVARTHVQGIIGQAVDQNDLHSLNGDFDYTERWATVGAVMFYRQYQHLQTFIEQADRCDARARDLFLAFRPEDSAEADREEEAELHPTQGLTEDNLRRATEGRPEVTAEDEVPDGDLIDAAARAASHGEDLEIEDDVEELAE
ncbi:hypothetical protein KC340_g16331 [Hortaea werneckii]|nr:hypothetical protein KC342_g16674 [Hortaea werneckii]KAI7061916.1 hypothetical protein KC339_g16686 [Hortaea werneckii]KAI7214157.1 hypothetical protein KC365_g14028 [Hortaea werneckii]KAI7293948.1 hypothetical protein KC340_g16331 [Hortaea werneckii]KAI7375854.1 hypothetical protein KC328_g15189 [Hortaea werneckii]